MLSHTSTFQVTCLFFLGCAMALHAMSSQALAESVRVSWERPTRNEDNSPLSDLNGFRVFWGELSGSWPSSTWVGDVTTATISNLDCGTTYSMVVRAEDFSGNRSQPSNEVVVTTKPCVSQDQDGDGISNDVDNCPFAFNPDQADADADGRGDVCDSFSDSDGDGVVDEDDNCPTISNPDQADSSGDGKGDACASIVDSDGDGIADSEDNCPNFFNRTQKDSDGDSIGDYCDPLQDSDDDGLSDRLDNCPTISNPDQSDTDSDGYGNVCDNNSDTATARCQRERTVDLDFDGDGLSDLPAPPLGTRAQTGVLPSSSGYRIEDAYLLPKKGLSLPADYFGIGRVSPAGRRGTLWLFADRNISEVSRFTFGRKGDTALVQCFFNNDDRVDPVLIDKASGQGQALLTVIGRSYDELSSPEPLSFDVRGTIQSAHCADFDNDGEDELFLHSRKGRTKDQLSIYSRSGELIQRRDMPRVSHVFASPVYNRCTAQPVVVTTSGQRSRVHILNSALERIGSFRLPRGRIFGPGIIADENQERKSPVLLLQLRRSYKAFHLGAGTTQTLP